MKKIFALLLLLLTGSTGYVQTIKVKIDAACVAYNLLYNKAFAAVWHGDSLYANNLVQLNPYNGTVEKTLPLGGKPYAMDFTPDKRHLYLSYYTLHKIVKIDLEQFAIVQSIDLGAFTANDFAILPSSENVLIVARGEGGYPRNVVMYKEGVLQPKQVSSGIEYPSSVCIKADGSKLYAHNGISSMSHGHIMDIADDGIGFNGIIWDYMMPSFGDIRIHDDLLYDHGGNVLDAFSDTLPITRARMPLYLINDGWGSGFEYSPLHGCYIYAHRNTDKLYLSFFHGEHFNYLGSLALDVRCDAVRDLDVVDESHFIVVAYDTWEQRNSIYFYHNINKNRMLLNPKAEMERW
jgi:hypothetical protein